MSNPAVTKLVRGSVDTMSFWMDDNIGESIHIHLADFRLDLSAEDLHNLSEELKDTLNDLVRIDGFDCRSFDPVFLSRFLAPLLAHLKSIKIDTVSLADLKVCYDTKFGFVKYRTIRNSRAYKALNGDTRENDDNRGSHHIGQTSQERLDAMSKSVSMNGYPFDNHYIILYNNQMLIRDGQHRASCLLHENGNIEIPVMRLYFDDKVNIEYHESYFMQLLARIRAVKLISLVKRLGRIPCGVLRRIRNVFKCFVSQIQRRRISDMRRAFFEE